MSLIIRSANRICDFCGIDADNSPAQYGSTTRDSDRDICRACVIELARLFNVHDGYPEEERQDYKQSQSPSKGFFIR